MDWPSIPNCFKLLSFNDLSSLVFQFRHFGQAAKMALGAAESRGEKCFDQFPGERLADHAATQAYDVHIVILDPLVCRKSFVNQACTCLLYTSPSPRDGLLSR